MIKKPIELEAWQSAALLAPMTHFAMFGGIGAGKSATGAIFAIHHITTYPELTGFIGANSYDQMNQATLRELMYWLDHYEIEYVVDQRPPAHWGAGGRKEFKKYSNILSCYYNNKVVTIFTRVLSDPNPLRGVEFSWYWIDETRDTDRYTHDVILGRLRESQYRKGLITTSTNGEDWAYERFVKKADGKKYGSLHVATIEAVRAGNLPQAYYDDLRSTYSPLMAMQELDALHVNILGGRAYYAQGEYNRKTIAPWGDEFPDPSRPLVVGCDFNFQPAPCIWVVGQEGPGEWSDHFHWFGEVSGVELSTHDMTMRLVNQYPNFFYQFFGDASGNRGTTSNAGEHDYAQMNNTLTDLGIEFTINVDQANPMVKDRVEAFNAQLKNGLGQTHMTYNHQTCPHLDADLRIVGWKTSGDGKAKLDTGGDVNRTHASDGAGYAIFKLRPPGRTGTIGDTIRSPYISLIGETTQAVRSW